ncbi:FeoB-associated Cys-rich membrane protein [Megalodesulfovibrio gigas]|uniref:FeoB-associated Cys-rich membrane protein n=1 Tax=Megalodesulfovibrio gigas TaxID=879 RepID=UPI0003F5F072|nr:FeoB-associated Cys-rich membrane protein [Megalodesulfovibrio gigas]
METAIVLLIVATAAVYVFRKFARPLTGKGGACGCGSAGCSASRPSFKTSGKLVELRPRDGSGCGCSQGLGCTCEDPKDDTPTQRLQ